MLIISRRVGESVRIGDDVVINVLKVKGNQVRLGVTAPKNLAVHHEGSESSQSDGAETSRGKIGGGEGTAS